MTIGPTIRALRESAGLTQAQVGKRMPTPITKQRVGAIEAADDLQYSTVVAYLAAVGYEIQIISSRPGDGGKSEIKYKWFNDGGFIIREREDLGYFELLEVPQYGGEKTSIGLFSSINSAKEHADMIA